MKPFANFRDLQKRACRERGSMLLELLIAIVVLATGMAGILILLVSAMYTNNRSGADTSATMVAEHIMEQISSQPANSVAPLSIADCQSNAWTVDTAGAPNGGGNSGSYGGNGAMLTANGAVDWTQSYGNVPAGYAMRYVACGTGGRQTIYDVRWNVISLNSTNNSSRMIFVSSRPTGSKTVGGLRFVVPVNLRTIGGMP